jgi:hypothetical protein
MEEIMTDNIHAPETQKDRELTLQELEAVSGGGTKTASSATKPPAKVETYLTYTLENTLISG